MILLYIGLFCGFVALLCGILAVSLKNYGLCVAGVVTGIIGEIAAIILLPLYILVIVHDHTTLEVLLVGVLTAVISFVGYMLACKEWKNQRALKNKKNLEKSAGIEEKPETKGKKDNPFSS